jgi:hypothetical protein
MFDVYKARTHFLDDSVDSIPTHRVLETPADNKILMPSQFVKYDYPKPRDYGQIGGYSKTAEPLKIALVDNDYEWRVAVENWIDSDLFIRQPFGLEELIRRPRAERGRYRLHYARFVLPSDNYRGVPSWSKYWSDYFFAYYFNKDGERLFIHETAVEVAFNDAPISWHIQNRGYTIPQDWLTNRIDENRHKYDLFA